MAVSLDTKLQFLPGVGPRKAEALIEAGLATIWDLLHTVPRCIGAAPPLITKGPLPRGAAVRVRARLIEAKPLFRHGQRMSVEAQLELEDRTPLRARFWNAGYLRRHFIADEWYLFEGKIDEAAANTILHPSFQHLPEGLAHPIDDSKRCRVAYRIPEQFSERTFAALVEQCLAALPGLADPLAGMADELYQQAMSVLHHPESPEEHERARRLFAQRELAALAWQLQERRADIVERPGRAWSWTDFIHERALARLPFALTPGQVAALAEIRADMRAPKPMYRLLQGDVGSGKTALALVSALAVIAEGAQVLLLAPTAVLARQHYDFCARCLQGSKVRIGVLTGGLAENDRRKMRDDLSARNVDLVIGTHALLQERVAAAMVGLVIIDEQHKFGVEQRAALVNRAAQQGFQPDLLLMTATPIPRTLALTAFGDLSVSRIADKPPGRAPVTTELARYRNLSSLDEAVHATLAAGGQVYIICPLREDSEAITAEAAHNVHEHLLGAGHPVALLTGAMPEDDKLARLAEFVGGGARILVSTTVVEVGVHVPNATLMIVIDAERFGLAQLHQLRGRIGRGDKPGRCLLFHRTAGGAERLDILCRTTDGLAIAEADLADRGPGQLLGTDQHGLAQLRIADLARDLDLLQSAHQAVRERAARGEKCPAGLAKFRSGFREKALLAGG